MFNYIYNSSLITKIIPTLPRLLEKSLIDCETLLDLGCGPSSPIGKINHNAFTTGVDGFEPYIDEARSNATHNVYYCGNVLDMEFDENSFDVVILIDVIEHLIEEDAIKILVLASKWAKKKVIVNTPNGFVKQHALDGNPLQEHLSGWPNSKMKSMGFTTRGLAGLKFLRQEVDHDSMSGSMLNSIKLYPKSFWFLVAAFSQIFTYRAAQFSFSLFCVKEID